MMEAMMMKDEHHPHHHTDYHHNPWGDVGNHYSPHTQSPAQEYPSYGFPHSIGMPMEPSLGHSMPPMYSSSQNAQPLYTTQWPSMLSTSAPQPGHMTASHLHPISGFPNPPVLPRLATHHSGSSRRTLTDQDRRRMCQYHEDHPNVKQTEIGAMFGVERSTVSKVLRQKEKYLYQEDGSRSPIKKPKGKFPDIERALSNWARNHQRSGLALTDDIIREKARFFVSTVGSTDCTAKINSTSWLEKFKQKNHLMGAQSRKGSDASEVGLDTSTGSGHATPGGVSPISPPGYVPSSLSHAQITENLKAESPDSYAEFSGMYKHGQAQSATSLASGYTEATAPSSFSPHSPTSPFFVADMQKLNGSQPVSTSSGFPAIPANGHAARPALNSHGLQTPIEDYTQRNVSGETSQSQSGSTVQSSTNGSPTIRFPPTTMVPESPPTQEDARKAMELVLNFFQHQPQGIVDVHECVTMERLMKKLKVQGSVGQLPGGMHSIDLLQTQKEMSRRRSLQGLI